MKDTIDRQDAIRIIDGIDTWQSGWRGNAIENMKALPSVQPEIIRCRDCRYSTDFYQDGCCYCKRPSEEMRYIEEGYGFYCAGAKRRTDGTD